MTQGDVERYGYNGRRDEKAPSCITLASPRVRALSLCHDAVDSCRTPTSLLPAFELAGSWQLRQNRMHRNGPDSGAEPNG